MINNLDWNKLEMQRVLLGLSRESMQTSQLCLHNSHSSSELQARLNETLSWMSALGFDAEAGEVQEVVGLEVSPVWRVTIRYRYEPYHFRQLPLTDPFPGGG